MSKTYEPVAAHVVGGDLNDEAREILNELVRLMVPVLADGQTKRRVGKPYWKEDPDHLNAGLRHCHRYDMGETHDEHSGAHPLTHGGTRFLMRAWQETHGNLR